MTREKQIEQQAFVFYESDEDIAKSKGFIDGAKWADQHPREGLWNAEKVIEWLKSNSSKYMTEGIDFSYYAYSSLVEDLRKVMEE